MANPITNHVRVALKDIVASQLPAFVRAQYPTFVAFLEAYYEFLDRNNIDLHKIRDIDDTLDEFIKYFKQELAHNYPISNSIETEKYLLKHVREQYLSKGSEASYKLLFRLLFGKDVYMDYPGKQMLKVSDGRWQQDVSLFVRVDIGNPNDLVGKTVEIQTSKTVYRSTPVDGYSLDGASISKVTANIEKVIQFSDNIYEIFLNRNFYGQILAGDVLKYGNSFQGQILPCTAKLRIQNKGVGFKPGQVFQVSSGDGTSIWFKVLTTETYYDKDGNKIEGGLKTIDIIRFGIGYNTDFSLTLLPSSAVSNRKKLNNDVVTVSYNVINNTISAATITDGGSGYTQIPDVEIGGVGGSGATAHAVIQDGRVVDVIIDNPGSGYESAFINIIAQPGDTGVGAIVEPVIGSIFDYTYTDKTDGFTESGYLSDGYYWDLTEHGSGAVAQCTMTCTDVVIKSQGTGYAVNDTLKLTSAISGTDEITFKVTSVSAGKITGLSIEDGGVHTSLIDYSSVGYSLTNISSSGSGVKVIPTFSILDINITVGGSGYDLSLPVLDITSPSLVDGVPLNGTIQAQAKLSINAGQVSDVTLKGSLKSASVVTGGSGYNKDQVVYFTKAVGQTTGGGARGIARVTNGVVTSVEVENPGNGYLELPDAYVGEAWGANKFVLIGDQVAVNGYLYTSLSDGYLGLTPPSYTTVEHDAGFFVLQYVYTITELGNTDWNEAAGTTGVDYEVGDSFIANNIGSGTGKASTKYQPNGQVVLEYAGVQSTVEAVDLFYGGKGYVRKPALKITGAGGYSDGAYVGEIQRQFFIDAKDTISSNSALINVTLDAVARYPGYYKTNDGFLSDSMFIQDSYYFQAYAYVLKIDEQLESYSSVVRTMLHPSGMAMFGEYSISNNIGLNVALESLVKSLGVSLYDTTFVLDEDTKRVYYISGEGGIFGYTDGYNSIPNPTQILDVYREKDQYFADVTVYGTTYSMSKDLSTTYEDFTDYIQRIVTVKSVGHALPWLASTEVIVGQFLYSGLNRYSVVSAGTTGTSAPTHTSGTIANGTATLQFVGTQRTTNANTLQYQVLASQIWTANRAVVRGDVLYYDNRKYVVRTSGTTGATPPDASFGSQFNGNSEIEYLGTDVSINTQAGTATYTQLVGDPKESVYQSELLLLRFTKAIGFTGQVESVFAIHNEPIKVFSKTVQNDTTSLVEIHTKLFVIKKLDTPQSVVDTNGVALTFTLNTIDDPLPGYYAESGYVVLDPYEEGSYQLEHYSNGRDATFSL